MASKDSPSDSKANLMKDLKSLKSALDEDDDNVPLLLGDDDDIPVLEDEDLDEDVPLLEDEDDIPMLDALDFGHSTNKVSLELALRQLEALELAPQARKKNTPDPAPKPSLEEQIRANAGAPIIRAQELTKMRDNPFLNPQQKAQLDISRKLRDEAQTMAMITSLHKKKEAPPPPKAPINENSIDFTDNTFLKASTAPVSTAAPAKAPAAPVTVAEKTDGAADILLELEDDTPASAPAPKKAAPEKLDIDKELAEIDVALSDFGDIIIIDDDEVTPAPPPPKNPPPSSAQTSPKAPAAASRHTNSKQQDKEIHQIIDDIVDEYLIVLEAALRKKLKEKLPDLLKK